ncbi:MAG: metal ABC transporter substrate-binding protein [Desulfosalsimonadaceae bacterium]|nr:metal ABC transporter substrate-binding protein [Desulfosalsimonadaceae bacterium]
MKKNLIWMSVMILLACVPVVYFPSNAVAAGPGLEILTTTFPIFQITRNITAGRGNVHVSLMIPPQLGCPHDYGLTPRDMQKLSGADVLVINGLGMEEFLGAPLEKANADLKIIDSSAGIRDILRYSANESHEGHHHEEGPDGDHHAGPNPHLFASPRMSALIAAGIADALSRIDPEGSKIYASNAKKYAERMNRLADDYAAIGRHLKNNRIITQHGVFDYLARDAGLHVVAVVQAHAGQEPSASEMLEIIETIRHEKAGAVFTEPQYPEKIGRTIAKEAGIPAAVLDPAASGPENAPLDYYDQIMRNDMKIIEKILGTK